MHIMIYSHAPWSPSGYGAQTNALSSRLLKNGYTVSIVAVDHHSMKRRYNEIDVYPTRPNITQSYEDLYFWADLLHPDKVLQLFDAWVIGHQWIKPGLPVITYNPVDCIPLPRNFKESCFGSSLNIAMTQHALTYFKKEGVSPAAYIPHSVDTTFYKETDVAAARETLGFPKDCFIFGMIATNLTVRKNIPGQLLAFKNFLHTTKSNAMLYLHTATYEQLSTSFDILHLIKILDLEGHIIVPNQQKYLLNSFDEAHMLNVYNAIDAILCCSYGEGFGIPIIEAQACGKPAIVTNFSSMEEVAGAGAITINDYNLYCDSGHMGFWAIPSSTAITDAMICLYEDKTFYNELSKKAVKNAKQYDWEVWLPRWIEVFND